MKGVNNRAFRRQLWNGKPVVLQGLFEVTITTGTKTKNIFINNPTFVMNNRKDREITVESTITNANGLTQNFALTVANLKPTRTKS